MDQVYTNLMEQGYRFHDIDEMDLTGYLALLGRNEERKNPLYGAEAIDDLPFFGVGAI